MDSEDYQYNDKNMVNNEEIDDLDINSDNE